MMSDNRPYSFNDAKALTIAARLCRLYEERITAFEELDPDLGTDFRDDWLQAIDTAMNIPRDETTVDNQQISAALLAESLDQCAAAVRDLRYYANRAFKGKDEFNVFGFSRLSRMRHAPANYAVAVRTMHLLGPRPHCRTDRQGHDPRTDTGSIGHCHRAYRCRGAARTEKTPPGAHHPAAQAGL
jgi:hypothetical protein